MTCTILFSSSESVLAYHHWQWSNKFMSMINHDPNYNYITYHIIIINDPISITIFISYIITNIHQLWSIRNLILKAFCCRSALAQRHRKNCPKPRTPRRWRWSQWNRSPFRARAPARLQSRRWSAPKVPVDTPGRPRMNWWKGELMLVFMVHVMMVNRGIRLLVVNKQWFKLVK